MSTIVRQGSIRLRIFKCRNGKYERHEFRYTDHHGRRRHIKRATLAAARAEAERIAKDLAKGHHTAELTLADLASFRAGIVNLWGTGKTLELCTAEYAECRKLLLTSQVSPVPTLKDLAQFWIENRPRTAADLTIPKAIEDFLAWKKTEIGTRYHDELRRLLKRFSNAHPVPVLALTAAAVHRWLRELPATIGPRFRNNLLSAVRSLFTLPQLSHHPQRVAIGALADFKTPPAIKRLWKPEEFRQLLHAAAAELLPVLVLGGFCKLRTSEIRRTRWDQLRLKDRQLILQVGQTKTARARIIPLPPCAVAWLKRITAPDNAQLIWPHSGTTLHKRLRKLATVCSLTWRENALRKSACTYDELRAPGLERVAREAGNSKGILETNYLAVDTVTRRDARKWFRLLPPKDHRVIIPLHKTA